MRREDLSKRRRPGIRKIDIKRAKEIQSRAFQFLRSIKERAGDKRKNQRVREEMNKFVVF